MSEALGKLVAGCFGEEFLRKRGWVGGGKMSRNVYMKKMIGVIKGKANTIPSGQILERTDFSGKDQGGTGLSRKHLPCMQKVL